MGHQYPNHQENNSVAADSSSDMDQELLQRHAQGNTSAFWQLWEQYRSGLFTSYCLRWMDGDHEAVQDALNSAGIKACERLPAYAQDITNVKGWLIRFLHNHCMDIRRKRERQSRVAIGPSSPAVSFVQTITRDRDSPENATLHHEMGHVIRLAIEDLPLRQREAARLRFIFNMPYRDIAMTLNLNAATVRKQVQQARSKLKTALQPYRDGERVAE